MEGSGCHGNCVWERCRSGAARFLTAGIRLENRILVDLGLIKGFQLGKLLRVPQLAVALSQVGLRATSSMGGLDQGSSHIAIALLAASAEAFACTLLLTRTDARPIGCGV